MLQWDQTPPPLVKDRLLDATPKTELNMAQSRSDKYWQIFQEYGTSIIMLHTVDNTYQHYVIILPEMLSLTGPFKGPA